VICLIVCLSIALALNIILALLECQHDWRYIVAGPPWVALRRVCNRCGVSER
jgi:hypothetical protein